MAPTGENNLQAMGTHLVKPRKSTLISNLRRYKYFYILMIPALTLYLIFNYAPMAGISLAFFDYQFNKKIWEMPFVGFKHFDNLFGNPEFWKVLKNTLVISFGRLIIEFPMPIVVAVLLNEIRKSSLKRFFQTVYTFPHFLSWVLVVGILNGMLLNDGVINQALATMGQEKISFFTESNYFLGMIFFTNIWKEVGWGAIIYLATLAGIDPELYSAAAVDGANRWHRLRYITWPGIKSTAVIMLILNCGGILNAGFDQILNMYNPAVYNVADIIDTYIYRQAFHQGVNFSYNTAVGLFKSVISFTLVLSVNKIAKLLGEEGLF